MHFVRTSRDANTHNMDACCGEFFGTNGSAVPNNEKQHGTVYCYTQCGNCGAIWRDGFENGHHTEYTYDKYGNHPFEFDEFEWAFSHIDTNKLHDGRAIAVYKPTNNPLDTWEEHGYVSDDELAELRDEYDMDDFRKEKTFVFRFCEVAQGTVAPVPLDATVSYEPSDCVSLTGQVTDIAFDEDGRLTELTVTCDDTSGWYRDSEVTITADEFEKDGTVQTDPWSGVISNRPSI